jgi:hypothetical protein
MLGLDGFKVVGSEEIDGELHVRVARVGRDPERAGDELPRLRGTR